MAVLKEDFVRCKQCDNADFEEKIIVSISKVAAARVYDGTQDPLPINALEDRQVKYLCTNCNAPYPI